MINGANSVNFGCGIAGMQSSPKTSSEVANETIEKSETVR